MVKPQFMGVRRLILQGFRFRHPGFEIPRRLRRFAAMPIGAPSGETTFG